MNLLKSDGEKGIAILPAYRADPTGESDAQGDTISPRELWLAAMRFASNPRLKIQHRQDLDPSVCRVIMSFVTGPGGYRGDGWTAGPHTWIVGLKVNLETADGQDLWRQLKDGDGLSGLSIGGRASVSEYVTDGERDE